MIAVHELGLADSIALVPTIVSSLKTDPVLASHSYIGQLPTLVLDDGMAIFDSTVICEYLSQLRPEIGLLPAETRAHFDALRRQATGNGMMETLVRWMSEANRPAATRSAPHMEAFGLKMNRILDALEADAGQFTGTKLDIGHIAIGCALSYADFRMDSLNWRNGRPLLTAWYRSFAARPSVTATLFEGELQNKAVD